MRVNSINNTYKSSFKGLLQFSNNMVINPSQITHIETKSSKVEDFDRFDLPKKLKFNEVITVFEDGKFVERQPALSEYFEHGYDLRLKEEGMISLANGDKYYFFGHSAKSPKYYYKFTPPKKLKEQLSSYLNCNNLANTVNNALNTPDMIDLKGVHLTYQGNVNQK